MAKQSSFWNITKLKYQVAKPLVLDGGETLLYSDFILQFIGKMPIQTLEMGTKKRAKKIDDIKEDFFKSLMDEIGAAESEPPPSPATSSYQGSVSIGGISKPMGDEVSPLGFKKESESELVSDASLWDQFGRPKTSGVKALQPGASPQKKQSVQQPHEEDSINIPPKFPGEEDNDLLSIPEIPERHDAQFSIDPAGISDKPIPEYKPSSDLPFDISLSGKSNAPSSNQDDDDRTSASISDAANLSRSIAEADNTIAVGAQGEVKHFGKARDNEPQLRVVAGQNRFGKQGGTPSPSYLSSESSLLQAEALKIAQQRIKDLESEVERLRIDNDEIAAAAAVIRARLDEAESKLSQADSSRMTEIDALNAEIERLRKHAEKKEFDAKKFKSQSEELEARLKSDYKKIRTRERELENRLDLVRAEKQALVKTKDEHILELKRRIEVLQSESSGFRNKVLELNRTLGANNDQFKRTVRALRLALGNLEGFQGESPLIGSKKKAE